MNKSNLQGKMPFTGQNLCEKSVKKANGAPFALKITLNHVFYCKACLTPCQEIVTKLSQSMSGQSTFLHKFRVGNA
jgi:hypothetical protein